MFIVKSYDTMSCMWTNSLFLAGYVAVLGNLSPIVLSESLLKERFYVLFDWFTEFPLSVYNTQYYVDWRNQLKIFLYIEYNHWNIHSYGNM